MTRQLEEGRSNTRYKRTFRQHSLSTDNKVRYCRHTKTILARQWLLISVLSKCTYAMLLLIDDISSSPLLLYACDHATKQTRLYSTGTNVIKSQRIDLIVLRIFPYLLGLHLDSRKLSTESTAQVRACAPWFRAWSPEVDEKCTWEPDVGTSILLNALLNTKLSMEIFCLICQHSWQEFSEELVRKYRGTTCGFRMPGMFIKIHDL